VKREVDTCPKCGALISPNLARCRQCKHYLHGTQVEGFLLEHLLPGRLAAAPGTGVFFLLIIAYYALMVMFAGFESALGFSSYSVRQLGSTWSLGIWEGQYWRFVTSVFAHGGVVHLAFNLYALTIVGPLIEELYDRKKMMLVFGVSGVLSMAFSHLFYTEVMHQLHNSVGASGAVSGLIGACFVGAKRLGPDGRDVANVMLRWTAYMAIMGFAMGGIDNAAHAGGWIIGAAMAAVMPLGIARTVATQRLLSVVVLGLLVLMVTSIGLMLANLRGFPGKLEKDASPRYVFMFQYAPGTERKFSDQARVIRDCRDAFAAVGESKEVSDEQLYDCELAVRVSPSAPLYEALAVLHEIRGDTERAKQLRAVLDHLHFK